MVKTPCFDKNGVKRGAWSEDEDKKLRAYVQRYGHWNWSLLPKFAGLSRSGKSCRLRWVNYLRPDIKHGNFTNEEEDMIVELHNKLGNKWSEMAGCLPGRSDNEIKNRWHTHLKKRAQKEQTMLDNGHNGTLEPDQANPRENPVENSDLALQQEVQFSLPAISSESSSSSSSSDLWSYSLGGFDSAFPSDVAPPPVYYEPAGNFWTEPFLPDNDSIISSAANNSFLPSDLDSHASCQDMIMDDEFLWSSLDFCFDHNSPFIN